MARVEVRPGVEATRDFALLLREERVLVISQSRASRSRGSSGA